MSYLVKGKGILTKQGSCDHIVKQHWAQVLVNSGLSGKGQRMLIDAKRRKTQFILVGHDPSNPKEHNQRKLLQEKFKSALVVRSFRRIFQEAPECT